MSYVWPCPHRVRKITDNKKAAILMTFVLFLAVAIAPRTIASLFATGTESETDGCKFD